LHVSTQTELIKPALANLFVVGEPIVKAITGNWTQWKDGVQHPCSPSYGDVFGTIL